MIDYMLTAHNGTTWRVRADEGLLGCFVLLSSAYPPATPKYGLLSERLANQVLYPNPTVVEFFRPEVQETEFGSIFTYPAKYYFKSNGVARTTWRTGYLPKNSNRVILSSGAASLDYLREVFTEQVFQKAEQ